MTSEKFIGYFRLLEACHARGCPVCRCLEGESHRYLDALLYEQVTDPDTRRAIRASWGFCNWHSFMLLEIEHSIFGAAIIYEDLVLRVLRRTEWPGRRGRGWRWLAALRGRRRRPAIVDLYRERAMCPACASAAAAERRYLEALVAFVDDGDLQAAYARSDGLCLPHLVAVLEGGEGDAGLRTLVERTREKWARVGEDIASFVRKHDHRNREPYTDAEAVSYRRAFEMLTGARSVFGNDLRARGSEPPRARARPAPRGPSPPEGSDLP